MASNNQNFDNLSGDSANVNQQSTQNSANAIWSSYPDPTDSVFNPYTYKVWSTQTDDCRYQLLSCAAELDDPVFMLGNLSLDQSGEQAPQSASSNSAAATTGIQQAARQINSIEDNSRRPMDFWSNGRLLSESSTSGAPARPDGAWSASSALPLSTRSVTTGTLAGQAGGEARDGLVCANLPGRPDQVAARGNLSDTVRQDDLYQSLMSSNNQDLVDLLALRDAFGNAGSSRLPPPGLARVDPSNSNTLMSTHSAATLQQPAVPPSSSQILTGLNAGSLGNLNDWGANSVGGGIQQQQQIPSPTSPPTVPAIPEFISASNRLSADAMRHLVLLRELGVLDDVLRQAVEDRRAAEVNRQLQADLVCFQYQQLQQQQQQQHLQQLQQLNGYGVLSPPFPPVSAAVGQLAPRSAASSNAAPSPNYFNFSRSSLFGSSDLETSVNRPDVLVGGNGSSLNLKCWEESTHGQLPTSGRSHPSQTIYSSKVFLGGIPWDLKNMDLENAFTRYGLVNVEHPKGNKSQTARSHRSNTKAKDGFVYLLFENERAVSRLLLNVCQRRNDGKFYIQLSSEKMSNKDSEVIPWVISDSIYTAGYVPAPVDSEKTVFVGALHGELTAHRLAKVMSDLFGTVIYCGIDTDKHKYPIGSGRVTFRDRASYVRAVFTGFVHIKTSKFSKIVQIDPYLEDSVPCSKCRVRPGPMFCRELYCLGYFCASCWDTAHMLHFSHHQPMKRNQKKQQRS